MSLSIDEIIPQLTQKEKIGLLAGVDWWHTLSVPRLKIPSIRLSDGPNGVRGQRHFNSTPTTCIPVGTGLGATWNKDLLHQVGELLSEECKLKGARLLLGPTVNMQRSPLGGRGFESFSEDPVLSGLLAANYIEGVQKNGVGCSLKHLVCNDQEFERNSANSIVSPRALREIYLMPFQLSIRDSNPYSIMTSYNRLNGKHCSESKDLLQDIVRDEWNWKGCIVSDWRGTYSTVDAIKAGLDLEMPGQTLFRGKLLENALISKTITEAELNNCVRNILQLINDTQSSNISEYQDEKLRNYQDDKEFLKSLTAEGICLLKNENNVLPLKKTKKTAVIGFNAKYTAYAGGGSSLVTPYYKVSPLDAIKEKLGSENVEYEVGAFSAKYLPSLGDCLRTENGELGATIRIFKYPRNYSGENRELIDELHLKDISYFRMNDYKNEKLESDSVFYADIESIFTPEYTGTYDFGIAVHGTAKLFIDDQLVVDNATNQEHGSAFYGMGSSERRNGFYCQAGRKYSYRIEFGAKGTSSLYDSLPDIGGYGGLISGGILSLSPYEAIERAVKLAKESDQVILISGLNKEWETEGDDRPDMMLPLNNDQLITEIVKANPSTVVVIQSGTPVDMSNWINYTKAILYMSYGGCETGSAICDVIFGDINPSGKLPLSFPKKIEDNPAFLNFKADKGNLYYGEGVFIGYRYYEALQRETQFAFGYGLSYTEFLLDSLKINIDNALSMLNVSINVTNIGKVYGGEVVQLYVSQENPSVRRPSKELKDFGKVFLNPNEGKIINFQVPIKYATSFWDEEDGSWVSEKDCYKIIVSNGSDSAKSLVQTFETQSTFHWKGI